MKWLDSPSNSSTFLGQYSSQHGHDSRPFSRGTAFTAYSSLSPLRVRHVAPDILPDVPLDDTNSLGRALCWGKVAEMDGRHGARAAGGGKTREAAGARLKDGGEGEEHGEGVVRKRVVWMCPCTSSSAGCSRNKVGTSWTFCDNEVCSGIS